MSGGGLFLALIVGAFVGFILGIGFVATSMSGGSLDACRAAHPGHDCNIGWVVGEAFK